MPPDPIHDYRPPVAIGGVGGSGTRLIAQCIREAGYFIGSDLNEAYDNLWFTLLFKRIEITVSSEDEFDELVDAFFKGMTGAGKSTEAQIHLINRMASLDRDQHPAKWLQKRAKSLLSAKHLLEPDSRWGWKEPNTHVVLERLAPRVPGMKYIHVMRNGLDMAHSSNQNQLRLWGKSLFGPDLNISPHYSLKYWCQVHRRMLDLRKSMDGDFLLLNYDDFTVHPERGLNELLHFLEMDVTKTEFKKLSALIEIPESMGRFKQHGLELFDEADIAFVKSLGFTTEM